MTRQPHNPANGETTTTPSTPPPPPQNLQFPRKVCMFLVHLTPTESVRAGNSALSTLQMNWKEDPQKSPCCRACLLTSKISWGYRHPLHASTGFCAITRSNSQEETL